MTKAPKRLPPDLPADLMDKDALTLDFFDAIEADSDIEAIRFSGVTFDALDAHRIVFRGCAFERCTFLPCGETRFDFLDCTLHACDFAGMQFSHATMHRVALTRCRGTGLYLNDAYLRNVSIDDCQFTYANFGMAKLHSVDMADSDFSHGSFGNANFTHVTFARCKLSGAELFGTRLKGMDLRTDAIDGIVLGDRSELIGAKVTPLQACDLALLLGLLIEPLD